MTDSGDLERFADEALAGLGPRDLSRPDADALRARCHAALAARRRRGAGAAARWRGLYDRALEPAAAALLGGGVVIAIFLRALAVFTGRGA
jgi:hypothetical protein